jgi:pyridoxamine 5'-phosphate oxidase-like protein
MHETTGDLERLQALLDESYARAGAHLRSIFTEDRRIGARALSDLLIGVQILNVATVTAGGEPRVGPVDGHFHRGAFYFGSSPDSARFRHLRARPAVSATHTRGESLAVVVHGTATLIDVLAQESESVLGQLTDTYGARADFVEYLDAHYAGDWNAWWKGVQYARIDARAMFTFQMDA